MDSTYDIQTEIVIEAEDTGSVAWLFLPLLGLGWARRRDQA